MGLCIGTTTFVNIMDGFKKNMAQLFSLLPGDDILDWSTVAQWCECRTHDMVVEATFLSGVFLPLTSAEACEKSSQWLRKENLCQYWYEKARKHICFTDRHDMTLSVKVVLNPNTTNQPAFSHNVFYSYISLVRQKAALCGNGLMSRCAI